MNIPSSSEIETHLLEALQKKAGLTFRLDIINKCNLRCIMCSYSDDAVFRRPIKLFTPQEFEELFKGISQYVRNIMLSCSDEPLASKHFVDILDIVSSYPPTREISLCTNAMLMRPRISGLFIEKGVTNLMLSMDGATKSTQERIRVGSKYEQVVRNIKVLRDIKNATGSRYPIMTLNFVMMNSNVHEAPAFVQMASLLGVNSIDFRHVVPTSYWNDETEILSNNQAKYNFYHGEIMQASRQYEIEVLAPQPFETAESWTPEGNHIPHVDLSDFNGVRSDYESDFPTLPDPKVFPENFPEGASIPEEFPGVYCHRPFSDIQIRNLEEVMPCPWHKATLGNLNDGKSLREVFFGPEFARLRKNMYSPEGDPNCEGCIEKAWTADRKRTGDKEDPQPQGL